MRISILTKFLLTMLAVALVAVGSVTYSAVRKFLDDKTLDVYDRNNLIGTNVAVETRDVFTKAESDMRVFAGVYLDPKLPADERQDLAKKVFQNYPEFVRLSILQEGKPPIRVYNRDGLKRGGYTEKTADAAIDAIPIPDGHPPEGGAWVLNRTPSVDLPVITVAVPDVGPGGENVTLVGDLLPDTLWNLFNTRTATQIYLLDGDSKILAHADAKKMLSREAPKGLANASQATVASNETSIFTDDDGQRELYTAAAVGIGKAVVVAYMPERVAFAPARQLMGYSVMFAIAVFLGAVFVSIVFARRMTSPLLSLSRATERIAKGDFGATVPVTTTDEIGDLAGSFNKMGSELTEREKKLEEARMALVQSEKMAAFGQLGAGIAHEVKNPLAGILGYCQLAMRKITPDQAQLKNYLEIVEKETKRCKSIIENLLKFARQEKTVMDKIEVGTLVEDSMKLVEHQLNMNGVKIEKQIEPGLPPIFANANQLQQVLMNLSINAQHAMEKSGGGKLIVSAVKAGPEAVEIRVADTGHGIPKDIMQKIFEPFFTTKPAGKGTGLGLSVTYGIIRDHKGSITVDSEVGKGTTFHIKLPTTAPADTMAAAAAPSSPEAPKAAES